MNKRPQARREFGRIQAMPLLPKSQVGGHPPGGPPKTPPVNANNPPPKKETLTEIFNRAAKPWRPRVVTKAMVKSLERLVSNPAPTYDMTPIGRIKGSYDPRRDRQLREVIKALKERLNAREHQARDDFRKAQMKGSLRREFNRQVNFQPKP